MVKTNSKNPAIKKGIDAVYALNADTILREQIRQRDKAIRDYENDMATAIALGKAEGKAEGLAEGRIKERFVIAETMRQNGFTEEQIRLALGGMTTS